MSISNQPTECKKQKKKENNGRTQKETLKWILYWYSVPKNLHLTAQKLVGLSATVSLSSRTKSWPNPCSLAWRSFSSNRASFYTTWNQKRAVLSPWELEKDCSVHSQHSSFSLYFFFFCFGTFSLFYDLGLLKKNSISSVSSLIANDWHPCVRLEVPRIQVYIFRYHWSCVCFCFKIYF
jgi:hypothetical protein